MYPIIARDSKNREFFEQERSCRLINPTKENMMYCMMIDDLREARKNLCSLPAFHDDSKLPN
jgi:hypothetical protein